MTTKQINKINNSNPTLKFSTLFAGREMDFFIENISMLLASGMGIASSIESIEKESKSKRMKRICQFLLERTEEGSSLWKTLDEMRLFPEHTISLIKIGEESGQLAENLKIIADGQQKERGFRSKIKSAMIYPLIIFSLTVIVGLGVSWFVLPKLATVFSSLKVDLPIITQIVIKIGLFLKSEGLIFVPSVIFGIIVIVLIIFFLRPTKFIGESILFHMPGIRRLMMEIEISRFGFILGSLLESGMPIVACLNSLHDITTLGPYKKFYKLITEKIEDGNSFQKSFRDFRKSTKLIPSQIQAMIFSGERSGNLANTLKKIGQIYEEKTDISTKNLAIILEPIMLIVVWVGVFLVAVSVIMPIYSLIGGFEKEVDQTNTSISK